MSYGTISNEWLNKNNLETLWAAIVRDFVHAGANPVSGGDGGTTKGSIPYWGANSTPTGTGQPIQPSHLQIGSVGQFIGVSSNGIPEWTTPQILQAGGSSSTALTLYLKNASSVALTLQVADETHWGILTDGTQTLGGDKTFAGHVHGNKNIEASWGMCANGIADLAFGEGGGGGTVTRLVLCGTDYEPEGGVITVPASSLQTGLGLGAAAYKNIGVVTSGDMNLVTGDAVNSAINSALTAAMKIEGETTTNVITNPTANPVTIDGQSVSAYKGMVVFYSSKEFVWTGSSWKELGDEGSFALRTITITGTGYLGGGGDLSVNRSLDLTDTAKGYITEGRNAYGYFTGGILDAAHMSAANIVSALGTTPVNRAIADKNGNDITTQYAVASTTAASIGELYVMTTDNYDSIQLIDGRLYDIEPYVYEMMQVARPDVDNSELNIIGSLNASRNIHASWGVSANGIADLAFGGGGGGGTITQIQIDGVPQEDVDGVVNLPAYPNIEGLASQTWVTAEITALNLGTASTHAHTDYVTGITWDSTNRKLKQSKGGGTATDIVQFGTAYSHDHDEYLTALGVSGKTLTWSKGGISQTALTVPYAKESTTLETEPFTNQEFTYRVCPKTIDVDSVRLDRIKGKTLVWNQRADATLVAASNATASNKTRNGFTGSATAGSAEKAFTLAGMFPQLNHKYYLAFDYTSNLAFSIQHYSSAANLSAASSFTHYSSAGEHTSGSYVTLYWYLYSTTTTTWNLVVRNLTIVDLTLMFGSGNEPTAADFEKYYLGSFAYNAGELINNSAKAFESVGFNLWDEEWELGKYSDSTGAEVSSTSNIRSKNYTPIIGGETYFYRSAATGGGKYPIIFFYDANKNYIRTAYVNINSTFATPNGACYIRFYVYQNYGTTYNHDICINLSDTNKNGTYEPYKKTITDLNLQEIRVNSPNIWDEEWEKGDINSSGQPEPSTLVFRSKNFIPVDGLKDYCFYWGSWISGRVLYIFWYDKDYNFIPSQVTITAQTATKTAPTNAKYLKFRSGGANMQSTYNNDICINVSDSAFNGRYFPHGVITFNGLKSAGSVYDEISSDGRRLIRRVGDYILGDLNWTYYDTNNPKYFNTTIAPTIQNCSADNVANIICDKYNVRAATVVAGSDDGIGSYNFDATEAFIRIYDSSCNSKAALQTKLANNKATLYFILKNYETYDLVEPIPMSMPSGTTERRLPEDTADSVIAPFSADMTYGTNPGDILSDVIKLDSKFSARLDAMDISHYQSSQTSAVDTHVITINGKKFYLKFNVTEADSSVSPQIMPAFDLEVSDTDDNTGNVQSFSFGTMSESEITSICHL